MAKQKKQQKEEQYETTVDASAIDIDTVDASGIVIDTVYYEAVHGDAPTADQEGPFTFQPPSGPQAWKFLMSYEEAVEALKKEAAGNIGAGTYYLLPNE